MFGLTSQIRRAAVSISANIAESCGRHTDVDFARLLDIGLGSVNEVNSYLELSKDLRYISEVRWKKLWEELVEIRKMLTVFA
jgi:four helix bundle protein